MSEKLFLSHIIQSDLVYMFENEKLACNKFYFTFGIKQKSNKFKTKKRKIKKKARNKLKSSSHDKNSTERNTKTSFIQFKIWSRGGHNVWFRFGRDF